LLPEEIFGPEDVPEYILSDSSAENKTPRQNRSPTTNCAIAFGILEQNPRDITTRFSAEREHRMSLEALVGGTIFILI
jgi:hypothetical protein